MIPLISIPVDHGDPGLGAEPALHEHRRPADVEARLNCLECPRIVYNV